jgi:hypothetical protein
MKVDFYDATGADHGMFVIRAENDHERRALRHFLLAASSHDPDKWPVVSGTYDGSRAGPASMTLALLLVIKEPPE